MPRKDASLTEFRKTDASECDEDFAPKTVIEIRETLRAFARQFLEDPELCDLEPYLISIVKELDYRRALAEEIMLERYTVNAVTPSKLNH